MRRPAHQASARPTASATHSQCAGQQQRLAHLRAPHRVVLRCVPRSIPARLRASGFRSASPTVCGVTMPGAVCTLARNGALALRVMPPSRRPCAASVDFVARVSRNTTASTVSSRMKSSISVVSICCAIVAEHGIGHAVGNMARDFARAQRELAEHATTGVRGGRLEQRHMLCAIFVHHDRTHRERHRDGGCRRRRLCTWS